MSCLFICSKRKVKAKRNFTTSTINEASAIRNNVHRCCKDGKLLRNPLGMPVSNPLVLPSEFGKVVFFQNPRHSIPGGGGPIHHLSVDRSHRNASLERRVHLVSIP